MKESQSSKDADHVIEAIQAFGILAVFIMAAPLAILGYWGWKNPSSCQNLHFKTKLALGFLVLAIAFLIWLIWLSDQPLMNASILKTRVIGSLSWKSVLKLPGIWLFELALGIPLLEVIPFIKKPSKVIRTTTFKKKVRLPRERLKQQFEDPKVAPIGVNVETGQVESLDEKSRCSHMLVLGTTGTGKSTLMFNLAYHAVKHNQPAIIIDPKGEMGSLERFIIGSKKVDPQFEKRLKLFSLHEHAFSLSYNPLKNGTIEEKKDRLLEALTWSEQFYQSMAGSFLSTVITGIDIAGIPLNLDYLEGLLLRREMQRDLKTRLADIAKSGNKKAERSFQSVETLFERKGEFFLGLHAQISVLNTDRLREILSPEPSQTQIDLREILKNNQIAYFQLNTLGNADTSRRLGRMIVEDAKALANFVYGTQKSEATRKFLPIFIDEFGSVASKEFIEFLKQSRGAKFGIHLFSQGLEDRDAVSPEFRRQAVSNPMTTISFRVQDDQAVNEIASLAGTIDAVEQSYQVEGKLFSQKTGMGNMRETKQMVVEHDVFRKANNLEGVVMKKSPSRVAPFKVHFTEEII